MSKITVHNPATGAELGTVPVSDALAVQQAIQKARAAQREWARVPLEERCARLRAVRDAVLDRTDEIADLLAREMGKPAVEAVSMEVLTLAGLIDHFAREAPRILAPEPIPLRVFKHRASYLHFPPRGVIGIIGPWNFPFNLNNGPAAMALIAGNAVVIKPSEFTPLIAELSREIFVSAGIPEALYQVVHGDGPTGAALITGPEPVDMVIFTGSVATGRRVAAACGERLIPCVTELGGKAPALVLADADLDRTARALAWGAFANCGQVCASVERALVHRDVRQPLLDRLLPLVNQIHTGDPTSPTTQMGPLNNDRQRHVVHALVQDALDKGATALTGGTLPDGPGHFYPPTLLVDVDSTMRVLSEETFGPVLPMAFYADEDAMIAEANRSHLGLLAYVFSRDQRRARAVAERIEAGTVMINDVLASHGIPETPWGGVKASGIGHTHGDQGLRDLCEQRHVNFDLLPTLQRELYWYPYSEGSYRLLKRAQGFIFGGSLVRRLRALKG